MKEARDLFRGTGEMPAQMLGLDWAGTPLGPPETWAESLRSSLSICIGSRFPIAIYWGPQLALLYNDAWSPILGSKHPTALGRPAIEVWPEIWDTIGPLFEQVMGSGESTYAEDSLLAMNRHGYTEECYFNYTFTPIRGRAGATEGVFNAVIETTYRVISERRTQVLRALGETLAATRSIESVCTESASVLGESPLDASFAAIYLVTGAQARLASHAGIPAHAPAAEQTVVLGSPTDGERWQLGLAGERAACQVVRVAPQQFGGVAPGGAWPEPTTMAIVAPLLATTGQAMGFLVVGASPRREVDADYRQFAEQVAGLIAKAALAARSFEEERRRAEQLAALDRSKTAFFNNVSHELRTPLTLILGPLEEALRSEAQSLSGPELELARRNALRLLKLVNTLLDFSRIEAGRVQAAYVETDIASLTRELASAFESAVRVARLQLEVDCQEVAGRVFVDRDLWEKLVLNLLSNALKFTFEGSIRVRLRGEQSQLLLEVSDTGTGIAEEQLPLIFERFHRVPGARSRTAEGSGIGLALVSEIARLHGGTVQVESVLGQGSTFRVRMPLGSEHLPSERVGIASKLVSTAVGAEAHVQEALRWQLGSSPASLPALDELAVPVPATVAQARILIADDNADMREYLQRLLGRWHVEAVQDGQRALAAARERRPDLVLTDVMMPNLDGFGLLRELRADAALQGVPVIVLSARAGEEARVGGISLGADDYLAKPFAARELVARTEAQLQISKLRRAALAERDKLHQLFTQSPVPLMMFDGPELRFEFVSPSYVEMAGRSGLLGRTARECSPRSPTSTPCGARSGRPLRRAAR